MIVKHNITAMNNERCLSVITGREAKKSEKLSSGYRINRAADDAAGLSISEKMRRQLRGLTQASLNAQDGISLCQSAEGALHEVHGMLQRMNELAVQAANGINSDLDRTYLQEEVAQIISEVDRVASTTTFNEMTLLNGAYGKKAPVQNTGTVTTTPGITYIDPIIYRAVTTTQNPDPTNFTMAGYDTLKAALKDQIVPQAVSALLDTFDDTFGYLDGSNIGIGLILFDNPSDTTVAYVRTAPSWWSTTPIAFDVTYTLGVNIGMLTFADPTTGELQENSRQALESTITHEMMHALMYESLTSGMTGLDTSGNYVDGFPLWFVEGTAQMAGGGIGWVKAGLRIDEYSDEAAIQTALAASNKNLNSNTTASYYATGYLASMYLGYLAYGGNSMDPTHIAAGVDHILNEVKSGKSLSQVISENSPYADIDDFEAKFATDGAAFTKDLLAVAANGRGAVVTGDYNTMNLLPDVTMADPVYDLDTQHAYVENVYPAGYPVMSGGSESGTGISGPSYTPATDIIGYSGGTGGTTNPDAGNTGGNQGGGGTTPTTPGGTGGGGTTPTTPGGNQGGGGTIPTTPGGNQGGGSGITYHGGLSLQVGSEAGQHITVYIEAMNAAQLGIEQVDISTEQGASDAIDVIKEAISRVSTQRAELGACQNRLEHTVRSLDNVIENTQAAESRIRDTDMAKEMVELSNLSILRQAGQSMLAQTKSSNASVLALFA